MAGMRQPFTSGVFPGHLKAATLQAVLQAAGHGRIILDKQDL